MPVSSPTAPETSAPDRGRPRRPTAAPPGRAASASQVVVLDRGRRSGGDRRHHRRRRRQREGRTGCPVPPEQCVPREERWRDDETLDFVVVVVVPGAGRRAGLLAGAAAGCRSVRTDEGLAMLDVSSAADAPPFTTARFSVAGRSAIPPRGRPTTAGRDGARLVLARTRRHRARHRSGAVRQLPGRRRDRRGQRRARSRLAAGPAGDRPGPVSIPPARSRGRVGRRAGGRARRRPSDARDRSPADGAQDTGARTDAPTGAPRFRRRRLAWSRPRSAPAARRAARGSPVGRRRSVRSAAATSRRRARGPAARTAAGSSSASTAVAALPATYSCTGTSCCAGLVCGNTSLGHTCCGNAGAPCIRPDGADCCGALRCVGQLLREVTEGGRDRLALRPFYALPRAPASDGAMRAKRP